ncbi:alternative ribosome rescue aminoacyl-tRNA hydrolase ArfB [Flavobacterium enshiense]|uniref:alternative ribosome rescue aminoacyl-tRNA hydrolase ArfB n=1 Tax=Flavobacterium enshiense TaxID=1341165 RepID=UPI00345C9BA4
MNKEKIIAELQFKAVRSSGAGGQNVNKEASKVVLTFDVQQSEALSEEERELLLVKLENKISKDKLLVLNCDEDRSQLRNKEIVVKRFLAILEGALKVPKARKTTKIPRSVIEKRLKEKRNQSDIKQLRQKPKM